jgi:signal transduction histidine kinase
MILTIWEPIIVTIVFSGNTFLGFLVFFHNKKSSRNRYFLGISISIAFWILMAYVSEFFPESNPSLTLFFSRLTYISGLSFVSFLTLFSFTYKVVKNLNKVSKIICFLTGLLIFLILFSPFILQDIRLHLKDGFDILYGDLFYFLFLPYVLSLVLITTFNFFSSYRYLKREEKLQLQYFLIGLGIFLIASAIFSFLLPIITGSDIYYRLGNYSSIFFIGFTAYAIVAKQLFGIKVILTDFLVGIMGILLLILPLVLPTNSLKIFAVLIFLLFCLFGYFLIKSTHQEIRQKEEAEKLVVRERTLRKHIEKLDEVKTMFLLIASHQLRTPLSVMKGCLQLALSGNYGKVEGKAREFIENAERANEREITLVNNLLDLNKIQMGKMEFDFQPVQIEDLIQSTINEVMPIAKEKNLYLEFIKPKEPLPKINLDTLKMRQVLLNLIDNAIKYTKEGGIKVKCQIKNEKCQIAVTDTGMGLTQEERNSLFQLFSRSEQAISTYPSGVGIGLYFSSEIVKAHNGRIWAESEGKGKGTTFYIELPIS